MPDRNCIVTTPRKRDDLEPRALETAARTGLEYAPRRERSYAALFEETGADALYVEADEAPFVHTKKGRFFYHENTAGMRTKKGAGADPAIRALDVRPGDTIIDATLGLGCDALVIATALGDGSITGLESSVPIADIVARGLAAYEYSSPRLADAAKRINVVRADCFEYLAQRPDSSVDVIYFDPMFESTVETSSSMQRLKELADHRALTPEIIGEARRAARRRVVVKARRGALGAIGFSDILPSGNRIFYGIIEV